MNVAQFSNAQLVVPRATITVPATGNAEGDIGGTMHLHGQQKPARVHCKVVRAGAQLQVTGTVRIALGDFGIEEPGFMGSSGNFSLSDEDTRRIQVPFRAKVVAGGKERAMGREQSTGDCNSCHTEQGANGAPGRIMLP